MQANTQMSQSQFQSMGVFTLLRYSANPDTLLEIASKFSIGQLLLSSRAQRLLIRLLERQAKRLLQPGDELRHLNVSLKKKSNGDSCVLLRRAKLGEADCTRQLKMLLHNGTF
jgi:hypothetical protein